MNNNHPLATGLIAGAAVGVGVGLLLAPRRGSETRTQLKGHVNRYADGISKGYRTTRDKVTHGARETGRYVRDVADAVTRKARHADAHGRGPVSAVMGTTGQARDTKHRVG